MKFLLTAACIFVATGCVQSAGVRLERDYDYDSAGDSYYLKAKIDDKYRLVCWEEEYWADFQAREKDATIMCKPFDMTYGSPYTGTDYPGEVSLKLTCGDADSLDDCPIDDIYLLNCTYHVRIQCMEPVSSFTKMQPLSGILTGVCVALGVLCIITWIGCCCISCKKGKATPSKAAVSPPASQPQQQQTQMQYYPQQQQQQQQPAATRGGMYQQQVPPPQPTPQAMYPPVQAPYPPQQTPSAPAQTAYPPQDYSSAPPPSYLTVTGAEGETKQ